MKFKDFSPFFLSYIGNFTKKVLINSLRETMKIFIMTLLITTLLISEHSSASSRAIQLASFLFTVINKVIFR
jgi:hypothetical protein